MSAFQFFSGVLLFIASLVGISEFYIDDGKNDLTVGIISLGTTVVLWLCLVGVIN